VNTYGVGCDSIIAVKPPNTLYIFFVLLYPIVKYLLLKEAALKAAFFFWKKTNFLMKTGINPEFSHRII
jgi:hypothetical protein